MPSPKKTWTMAFGANNTVCPMYSTVTEIFIVYHQNKVMYKKKLKGNANHKIAIGILRSV